MPQARVSRAGAATGGFGSGETELLRRLSQRGSFVSRRDGEWQIFSPRHGLDRPVGLLLQAELDACVRSRLLTGDGERWVLSSAGLALLRRQLSRPVSGHSPKPKRSPKPDRRRLPSGRDPDDALDWLRRHKGPDGEPLIGAREYEAGERLRSEFLFAQLVPRITSSWSPTASASRSQRSAPGAGVEIADSVEAARTRVWRALVAAGPELAGVLVDACCHLRGIRDIERIGRLPQRSGKLMLKVALTVLARHYGLLPPDDGAWLGRIGIRHWGSPDFRPSLEAWKDD